MNKRLAAGNLKIENLATSIQLLFTGMSVLVPKIAFIVGPKWKMLKISHNQADFSEFYAGILI